MKLRIVTVLCIFLSTNILAQKPILTTAMKECKKYESVNIANTHEEFIEKLPQVIAMGNDEEYKKLLLKEASENTWSQKSEDIIKLLEEE